MLDRLISSEKSPVYKGLSSLRDGFLRGRISSTDSIRFVFLCGANKSPGVPSARRTALAQFGRKTLPSVQFFFAEELFNELQKIGPTRNLLDIENDISSLADHILIVLESNSAFCELGAFAHKSLREKLIVINDEQYKTADSFIRHGPIKAIEEGGGNNRILHYKMSSTGIMHLDAIGMVFQPLYSLLRKPLIGKPLTVLNLKDCHPKNNNKSSLQFLHDLVYFSGPVMHREIILVLEFLFGTGNYDPVRHQLSLLRACDIVESTEYVPKSGQKKYLYHSSRSAPFFKYSLDWEEIMAAFKTSYFKIDAARLS